MILFFLNSGVSFHRLTALVFSLCWFYIGLTVVLINFIEFEMNKKPTLKKFPLT